MNLKPDKFFARQIGLWICWLFAFFPMAAFASFEELPIEARPAALGGAFTALADDLSALYYNPAGLSQLTRRQVSMTYGALNSGPKNSDSRTSFLGYAHPMTKKLGRMALGYQQSSFYDLYNERAVILGYARDFGARLALGVNFKYLSVEFTPPRGQTSNEGYVDPSKTDPLFDAGNTRSKPAFDLGLLSRISENWNFGLACQNVNQPNLALSEQDKNLVPITLRAGTAYKMKQLMLVSEFDAKGLGDKQLDSFYRFGLERMWGDLTAKSNLYGRGALAFGSKNRRFFALGLSYRFKFLQLDYGFQMALPGVETLTGSGDHRLTFSFKFGNRVDQLTPQELTQEWNRYVGMVANGMTMEERFEYLKELSFKLQESDVNLWYVRNELETLKRQRKLRGKRVYR